MPSQIMSSVENNFTKGLITEATGLNFPENAATSASNCVFTLIGDVVRREGINFQANGTTTTVDRTNSAMSSYVWNNPGGDGNSKLLVKQIGGTLYFYNIATATVTSPLSTQLLAGNILLLASVGNTLDTTAECQYADGNGYLFVYHTSCDPFAVSYNPVTLAVTVNAINVQIRDFTGVNDGLPVNNRPTTLSDDHKYNLANQGWTTSPTWQASSTTSQASTTGTHVWTVASGITGISGGQQVTAAGSFTGYNENGVYGTSYQVFSGTVTSYAGTTLTINCTSVTNNLGGYWFAPYIGTGSFGTFGSFSIYPVSTGYLTTWNTAEGNYPSNSDIWWFFKNSSGTFDPATTAANTSISFGQAPQGHYVLNAWNQDRAGITGINTLTGVSTMMRPTTGAWYAGRVWYTGLNASQAATGDANYYTWSENVYFSQVVTGPNDFGVCYQTNDPTAEDLNALLPTDGGVLQVVGAGTIFRLFPIANGLLVFAANGIWFITGSTGIGFSADDYTITKISAVKILSAQSFVDVLGLPYFWNEEGIYMVNQSNNGQLAVEPITVGTILTYYNNIPISSKKYARGSYDPINYVIQWCYRSTVESSVTDRYQFDTVLNYNNYNKAFYPYNLTTGSQSQYIHGVNYVSYPYLANPGTDPTSQFEYHCSQTGGGSYQHGFAEEYDTAYVDWGSVDFTSSFTTGYKLHGQAWRKFQTPYVYMYSRNDGYAAYYIQGAWDYGINFDSNRWSTPQFTEVSDSNSSMVEKRHKIRGKGYALQLMVTSVSGVPFDIIGWAMYDNVNAGV